MSVSDLTSGMFATADARAAFSARATLQGMLDFEAALARAEAAAGVIPSAVVAPIAAACRAELLDADALQAASASAGNLAIPLVKQLTARVAAQDAEAAKYVHWGATSQDAIDTALVLQLRAALHPLRAELDALIDALAGHCRAYRDTPQAGRTWLQQALPITLGLKFAGWLDGLLRQRARLRASSQGAMVLQFGGAAGTLASLGDRGLDVAGELAATLDLALPDMPWHTQRDRLCALASDLALLTGQLGKIARDISLSMQTEIAELAEPAGEGRGGSSAMPHKRNPVGCAIALTCATRMPGLVATMMAALVQEHERALGGWQAEWDTLPQIVCLTAAAVHNMREVVQGLQVDPQRLQANLAATHGLLMAEAVTMALGTELGRLPAHQRVEVACRDAVARGTDLRDGLVALAAQDAALGALLTPERLDRLLDPARYLGEAQRFVDRVLATSRAADATDRAPAAATPNNTSTETDHAIR